MKNNRVAWIFLTVMAVVVLMIVTPSISPRPKARALRASAVNIVSRASATLSNTKALLPGTTPEVAVTLRGAQVPPPKLIYMAPLLTETNPIPNTALTNK